MPPLPRRIAYLAAVSLVASAAAVLVTGCSAIGPGFGGPPSTQGPTTGPTDDQDYLALQHQLEAGRTQYLDKSAQELEAHDGRLFWKTYPGFDPVLHSRMGAAGAAIDYGFSIGDGDLVNYRTSSQLLVTALPDGDTVHYLAYDPTQANASRGQLDLPAPQDDQRWWAYAVSGNALYVVTTGDATTLLRWMPGESGAQTVTTVESAGAQVGEFLDFDVQGDTMVFIESGRLWKMSISANRATWLGNQTEIAGAVSFDAGGVTFEDSTGLKLLDYSTSAVRDLSAEIAANAWKIDDAYADADRFYSATSGNNFSRYGNWVVYTAESGVFAYDIVHKAIVPVLLTPIDLPDDDRVEYRYPVMMDDGECFIVGLTSQDGAVGADGPVYRVALGGTLN
jgi:hypothetical protein